MNCDCIVMKSKDIEISIPKEIFNSVDKGIRVKLDDDGSFIIEKMQFENLRRINRKHLNNLTKNTDLWYRFEK
ncbi:hypothetical protein ACQR3D_01330 [Clostridium perfringens]